jgi:mannose-6-phosphate isomerase-like protein (cupin superfamily)
VADPHPQLPPPTAAPPGAGARVERPWGWFEDLERGERHLVKKLLIRGGRRLSLQRHRHRCEHWVVVAGTGMVRLADETLAVGPGTALVIPQGMLHRAGAASGSDLLIIEVQLGDVLREDDIERFEDDFGRVPQSSSAG